MNFAAGKWVVVDSENSTKNLAAQILEGVEIVVSAETYCFDNNFEVEYPSTNFTGEISSCSNRYI